MVYILQVLNGGVTGEVVVGRRLQPAKAPFYALQYSMVVGSKTFACVCIETQNDHGLKTRAHYL